MIQNKSKKIHGGVVHGARSISVAQRYDDRRTEQGKALYEAISALMEHFGGPEKVVSAPMQILIDSAVRPKLIVLMQISTWVNKQTEVVDKNGDVPNVLGKHYLAYTNSLRRDLESLSNMAKDAGSNIKPPSIADIIG
jgi:hypothetical protein